MPGPALDTLSAPCLERSHAKVALGQTLGVVAVSERSVVPRRETLLIASEEIGQKVPVEKLDLGSRAGSRLGTDGVTCQSTCQAV